MQVTAGLAHFFKHIHGLQGGCVDLEYLAIDLKTFAGVIYQLRRAVFVVELDDVQGEGLLGAVAARHLAPAVDGVVGETRFERSVDEDVCQFQPVRKAPLKKRRCG